LFYFAALTRNLSLM